MKRIVLLLAMLYDVGVLGRPGSPGPGSPGSGREGPDHANSICSFSGLNDDPEEGGQVQSYGQGVRLGFSDPTDKTNLERPGVLCNAHLFPYPEGFGEETP